MPHPRTVTLANHDHLAGPAFQRHLQQAHAANLERHRPRPTSAPEPAPVLAPNLPGTHPAIVYKTPLPSDLGT